jgi:hypothetical protein
MRAALLLAALWGCSADPLPLPTEVAVAGVPDSSAPELPLFQVLYAVETGPAPSVSLQRVRLLLWLRHLELSTAQLDLLETLRVNARERAARLTQAEQALLERNAGEESALVENLWAALSQGVDPSDASVTEIADKLKAIGHDGSRSEQLMRLRLEGIRSLLDAQTPFLRTLTPVQEGRLNDALFLLRHELDPLGTPGDFESLVGTLYDPGQFGALTQGTDLSKSGPADIGALWGDEGNGLQGHPLHDAQREVILFLAVLEPGLEDAIVAAKSLTGTEDPATASMAGPKGEPGKGVPNPAPPGAPLPDGQEPAPPGAPQPDGEPVPPPPTEPDPDPQP